ncbi:phosphoglycerate mutase-like protein [Punctularia strigosozonata HHB-11173 SS5]|uniref:phosphoglycerate mutase-like protein n=1 Tax=Punctularia strigosozonata (strain HHB-11173) TaxID=741275 RepID=UPI0004417BBA|nr:phosphoglycerate mutase-like protein [Punctularia strigosozonata HHB-11173 SS5]EIN13699.1 phosphoglycerate mutase-like protein [Punctularia strigosozonata HHB-11173 SS5]
MLQKIYIARHGYRLNWVTSNWQSKTGLPKDPPLAAFGELQARELAAYFLSLPESERPTAILSSPYYRCLQTSEPTSQALNLPIFVEHGLSEWYSPVTEGTGLHPRPGSAADLQRYFPTIDPAGWSTIFYPSRKGETVGQVHDRAAQFLGILVPIIEAKMPGVERVLLFSHAATVIALVRALLNDRTMDLRVGCCSLTELERLPGANAVLGGWKILKVADGTHMKEGASRDWGFEDIEIANGEVVSDPGLPGSEDETDGPVGPQVSHPSARM